MFKLNLRIKSRLFILTAVALAPALANLAFDVVVSRRQLEADVHARALQLGRLTNLQVDQIVAGAEGLLSAVAQAPVVRAPDSLKCAAYFEDILRHDERFESLFLIDPGGIVICRSSAAPSRVATSELLYFNKVISGANFVVGEYTVAENSGSSVLPFAVPVRDDATTLVGVLVGAMSLEWFSKAIREHFLEQNQAISIADHDGVLLAREPYSEKFVGTRIPEEFQRLVQARAAGTIDLISQDGSRRILGYFPPGANSSGLYVSAGVDREKEFANIDRAITGKIIWVLAGTAIAFFMAWGIGNSLIVRPVRKLQATIRSWREGDNTARTGIASGGGELSEVGAALDKFMNELAGSQAFRREAEQTRELLMHELEHRVKNTLANVQALANQTLRKEGLSPAALDDFSARLHAMGAAHQLLVADNWRAADLRLLLQAVIAPFDREPSRFRLSGPALAVNARAVLAISTTIHELCTNAAKYGALSVSAGTVGIIWNRIGSGESELFRFYWSECGGPLVVSPTSTGFGSRMINRMLVAELSAKVEVSYLADGLACFVEAPAKNVVIAA